MAILLNSQAPKDCDCCTRRVGCHSRRLFGTLLLKSSKWPVEQWHFSSGEAVQHSVIYLSSSKMCGWNWPVDSTLVLGIDLTHLWFVVCIGETPFFPGIKNYLVDTWFLSVPELFHCQGRWRDEHQNCQIREEVIFFTLLGFIIAQDEVRPHEVHMQDFFWKYVFQVDVGTAKQWQSGIGCKIYLLKMKTCIPH